MAVGIIGKWVSGKLLGYAWDEVKASLQPPRIVEAFGKACSKVAKEYSDLFDHYTQQALASEVDVPKEEALWFKLEQAFANNTFPEVEQLTEMLVGSWRTRKQALDQSDASEFFSSSEETVRPIIEKISASFFVELAQMPELASPFVIAQFQKIERFIQDTIVPPVRSSVTLEELKDASLKASASLLAWPTTLGRDEWLERQEVETLFSRIESNSSSTTILLGPPGSGKSALLSTLARRLFAGRIQVLAIKADKLPATVDTLERLAEFLSLPIPVDACLRRLAMGEKAVLIIDQLDALSELVDRKSERLNVLLTLIQSLAADKNIHVVTSSRFFEFRHDTRLNSIEFEHLELQPLLWEVVLATLSRYGMTEDKWSDELQTLLKVPLHLKIFVDLRATNPPVEISISLQGLLEALWQERVLKGDGAATRIALLNKLAQRMSEDEELWVPRALADLHVEALEDLARQDVLTCDENGLRIGFRHQTYFDFARARHFAQGTEKLSEFVLARQDGLFIRPVLLSSLEYLRGADFTTYRRELLALWEHHSLKFHLRVLLIEFLAALENPRDFEISCLLPVLQDEAMRGRALFCMAGSSGWFRLMKDIILSDFMSQSNGKAAVCLSLLTQALTFDRDAVIELVKKHWLPDPQYDHLTLQVLQYLKVWDEEATGIASCVTRRTASRNISYLAEVVSQANPSLAPRIVRADLDRRYNEAEDKDSQQSIASQPTSDATLDDLAVHDLLNDPKKSVKQLLEGGDLEWYELSTIAESAPDAFLDEVWPWFVSVLERISGEPHPFVVGYCDDHCLGTKLDRNYGTEAQPISALRDAIVVLAKSNPEAFLNFFRRNEISSLLTVHRLLCKGLQEICQGYPQIILEYLTHDPRRLVIGDFQDVHRETISLLSSVVPHLNQDDVLVLEKMVLQWDRYYRSDETWTPEDRLNRVKWSRQHRLRLLRAIPRTYLSDEALRLLDEEERAFPGMPNWDSRSHGGTVGSRMSAEQMEKASDSEVVNLFEELVDSTGWDHPRFRKFEALVGGAIQASRELGTFAEREPARAATIVTRFKSGRQELAAGAVLLGLSKSTFPSSELFALITSLDSSGFCSNHFRTDVARALDIRAQRDKGLPDDMLTLMERWLPTHIEPTLERVHTREDGQAGGSILWGLSGGFSLPGGRDLVFDAIARGYLLREPQELQGWANVVDRALQYEQHPDVWKVISSRMTALFNGDKAVATFLFNEVLTRFPQTRETTTAIIDIANILPLIDDFTVVHKWLGFYLSGDWPTGHQAFGELLLLQLCNHPEDEWSKDQLGKALAVDSCDIDILRGLAFAAVYSWQYPACQDLCTDTLVTLAAKHDVWVHQAISNLFVQNELLPLTKNMRRIVNAVDSNPDLLMASSIHLIEGLAAGASLEPELVSNLCNKFLDIGTGDIKNVGTKYAHLAEPLVSIALTLHRMPSPNREKGLAIFERLSETNIQEARQALDTIDRRPLKSQSYRLTPRRVRRRKQRR